jgi:hypothetical protein
MMYKTIKDAGQIWMSGLRFAFSSPKLLLVNFGYLWALEFLFDVYDDISSEYSEWLLSGWSYYSCAALICVVALTTIAFVHLNSMRHAMRFATNRLEPWSHMTWVRRGVDFLFGYALYMGVALLVFYVGKILFSEINPSDLDRVSLMYGDGLPKDFSAVHLSRIVAYGLLTLALLVLCLRLSLWMPMAAFRRTEQWSPDLAWRNSRAKGLLLGLTLLPLEFIGFALIEMAEGMPAASLWLSEAISGSIPGSYMVNNALQFIGDILEHATLPLFVCIVIAIRTSVAASLLGIRGRDQVSEYFSYVKTAD